ncbi:hypothetical protein PIB30_074805, partial [Stylosanthes scabra]|nr:hypothetical protein [Stylosanthes scabra]
FGLAKICKKDQSIISILGTRGTPGYIAPEVFSRTYGGVSHKSDVYSYGMLILEIIGGRQNYESEASQSSESYFPDWIYKDLEQGNIPTRCLQHKEEENDIVMKMTSVSLWCIQPNPADRPSISKVIEMLEGPLEEELFLLPRFKIQITIILSSSNILDLLEPDPKSAQAKHKPIQAMNKEQNNADIGKEMHWWSKVLHTDEDPPRINPTKQALNPKMCPKLLQMKMGCTKVNKVPTFEVVSSNLKTKQDHR